MAQRQWRSDDTVKWNYGFGSGIDGDLTISGNTTEAPIDSSCSGTAGTNSLSATNVSFAIGQLILIHQTRGTGAGNWELAKIAGYSAGTITTDENLINTYTDSGSSQAQVRVMKQYNNVTVNNAVTYTSKAWNQNVGGIIGWFAKSTTITGNVAVSGGAGGVGLPGVGGTGGGFYGSDGSVDTNPADGAAAAVGETYSREIGGGSPAAYAGGGGGGQNENPGETSGQAGGGGGGYATSGGNGTLNGGSKLHAGAGGGTYGGASLVALHFGSGGGGGIYAGNTNAGGGGGGAGAIAIFSKTLTITGTVVANGGAGGDGTNSADGGSGAGGSILFKSEVATLGTALTTATGASAVGAGGSGGNGRIHLDYSGSYTGTTSPSLDATADGTIIDPILSNASYAYFM